MKAQPVTRRTASRNGQANAARTPPGAADPPQDVAQQARQAASGPEREAMIRLAAYALYEARGGNYGNALQDWLRAEAEVDQALATAIDAQAKPDASR
jgi:hypothetical protein